MITFLWPIPGTGKSHISSPYGNRNNPITGKPEFHKGIDIAAPQGTDIITIGDAYIVDWANHPHKLMGLWVVYITYNYRMNYFHCNELHGNILSERYLPAGSVIATVGDTGYTTGHHLHFQTAKFLQRAGETIDPLTLYNRHHNTHTGAIIERLESVKAQMNAMGNEISTIEEIISKE